MQFSTHKLRVQTVVLGQLSYRSELIWTTTFFCKPQKSYKRAIAEGRKKVYVRA